jgi:ATP-dependent phosphoenolpyruvate carboxykinase
MHKIHLKVCAWSEGLKVCGPTAWPKQRNAPVAALYEDAVKYEGAVIADSGALINYSGKKTGRSPKDKRIVFEETSKDHIWVSTSTHETSSRSAADADSP